MFCYALGWVHLQTLQLSEKPQVCQFVLIVFNITGFITHNHFDLQCLFVRGKLWQVFETALKSGGVRLF